MWTWTPASARGSRLQRFDFHTVDARDFLTISLKVRPGDADPTATLVEEISRHDVQGAVVRVQITLPGELEGHIRDGDIRDALRDAHFVASISREVLDRRQSRLGRAYSKGLDPREALRLYLESRDVPEDRAEVLMRRAESLMDDDPS